MSHRRPLTANEVELARTMFGDAIDYGQAGVANRKWAFFQPRNVAMAPTGCIHFHPHGTLYREDFGCADLAHQALFLHEMTHVLQSQERGRWYLPLMRHPLCRYDYRLEPGKPFERYGLEQQGEIVRHAFLLRRGLRLPNRAPLARYEEVLPFRP